LPVPASVENRSVLQGVGKPGLVLAEIDFFVIGSVLVDPKIKADESAFGGSCDVHINNAIAHFKVPQHGHATIELEALATLIFSHLGFAL
jgi:hypothetical protein